MYKRINRKQKTLGVRTGLVLVCVSILMGLLLSCPTTEDSSGSSSSSGGDAPSCGSTDGRFTFTNEYPDFHTYYAEVTAVNLASSEVTFLISDSATPNALPTKTDAHYVRKMDSSSDTLKTRKIYIGWTEQFTHAKAKTVRDGGTQGTYQITTTNAAATYKEMPWILKVNTQYYLHIYYTESGASKTFTRCFTTLDYPSSEDAAKALYPSSTANYANQFNYILNSITLERKATEPFALNLALYNHGRSIAINDQNNNSDIACFGPPNYTCVPQAYVLGLRIHYPIVTEIFLFYFSTAGDGSGITVPVNATATDGITNWLVLTKVNTITE